MTTIPDFVFFGAGDVAEKALLEMRKVGLIPKGSGEVGVVVSYGKIIPKSMIDSFKYGILNIHPSVLPALRGPSPIKSAILENLEITGVTIMLLDTEIDHGPILAQEKISLSPRLATANALRDALIAKGVEMLARVLPDWVAGKITPRIQDHPKATYTRKFKAEDGFISYPFINPEESERKVRALNPEPGTFTILSTKSEARNPKQIRLKILKAKIENGKFLPTLVQPAGKNPMDWTSFLRGNKIIT